MTPSFFILLMGISTIFSSETHKYFVRSPILFAPFHAVFLQTDCIAKNFSKKRAFSCIAIF